MKTSVFDMKSNKIIKEVPGRYKLADKYMNLYNVQTISGSKRRKTEMATNIAKFNSVKSSSTSYQLKGDIKATRNAKEKIFKLHGGFIEKAVVGPNGEIYHLLALKDGVIVRKIMIND